MEQLTIKRNTWIAAPPERVWQALTDPDHLAQWLLPPALGAEMRADADGTLFVCMGPMAVPMARLDVVEPLRHVISRSLPDQLLATTYLLSDENGGTELTVTMTGFEALPEDARQDRLTLSGAGWEKALANLNAAVTGLDLPFPQGYVAALFGYLRGGRETFAVERSIWINAPRERVWRAISDPAQIEHWFSPGTAWRLSALAVGERLFAPDPDTGAERYTQVIERVDPHQHLVMRSVPEGEDISQVTAYALREEQGGTRLTITNSGYEQQPEETRWGSMEQNAFGFGMMLANIQAYSEGKPLPFPGGF